MIQKLFFSAILALYVFLCFSPFPVKGQTNDIPDRPREGKAVNDFANFLPENEIFQLENKARQIYDSTDVPVVIVFVETLNGYEIGDYATRLGQKWGIGHKGTDKGVLILIKPRKTEESGRQVWISTGYGIESVLPDVICKRIVENDMIPSFKGGQYFTGINNALNSIYSLVRKEITPEQYAAKAKKKQSPAKNIPVLVIIIILVIAFFFSGKRGRNRHITGRSDLPFWLLMGSMMNSGRSGGGGFGNFSSGGGSFGGFGGGSFGGGGAGGSW